MSKMKWKNKESIEHEKEQQEQLKRQKERFKGKDLTKLSAKEKDELLIQMANDLGYL